MKDSCRYPIGIFLIVMTVCLVLDFIFVFYLYRKYGAGNNKEHTVDKDGKMKNVWQRAIHLLCYDCGVFMFMFVFIFQIVWASIGYNWISGETSQCRDLSGLKYSWIITIFFWVFLAIGFIIGVFTLLF
jgi:hypothetical protein